MGNITSVAFDVEKSCSANNEKFDISDCLPQFILNSTNNIVGVSSFGGVKPGEFKTDADVAGIGVLLAFIIPSAIALAIGAILSLRPINDRLPERFQLRIVNYLAPARPERLKVQYKGPPSLFRRPHRESVSSPVRGTNYKNHVPEQYNNPANQISYPLLTNPINRIYYPQSQYSAQGHHSEPENPYNDVSLTVPSDHSNVEDSDQAGVEDITLESDDSPPLSETLYDMLQAALQAITDSQILLSLALNFSFFVIGKCDMSLYHFRLAINIIEIACANSFLSLLLVRDYWKAPISAILRLLAVGISIYLLYDRLDLQRARGFSAERLPPPNRNNSLILLKAGCFLDKDLSDAVFTNTTAAFHNATAQISATVVTNQTLNHTALTPAEYAAVGPLDYTHYPPELIICIALIANLVLTVVYAAFRFFRRITPNGLSHFIFFSYCLVTWVFCLVVLSRNASYIFDLRRWVNGSGWFGTDSENYVGLGQWAALLAMGGILLSFFDRLRPWGDG